MGSGLVPTTTPGSLYVSLHEAAPGEAGTQETNETDYTGYARVPIARTVSGWAVMGDNADNAVPVTFAQNTGTSVTITHFGVGTSPSGSPGNLLYSGPLTAPFVCNPQSTPEFGAGDCNCSED